MCLATDGGYTFITKTFPYVWHTDQYGETLWVTSVYVSSGDQHEGFLHQADDGQRLHLLGLGRIQCI